ncbi:hypothetical protein ACFZDG_27030 [Kitasatospora xanthocidica]|uniref:hypothetical protein n=1 Tax=Kitasatospora xanthocidica TaxID=83382 RepID=UPI0036E37FF6
MTLTSMLDAPQSPLRRFLAQEVPDVRRLRAAFRAALPPAAPVLGTPGTVLRWPLVGMAVDHRLRCAMRADVPRGRAVEAGAVVAESVLGTHSAAGRAVVRAVSQMLEELQRAAVHYKLDDRTCPVVRDQAVEERVAMLCLGAAIAEEAFRCPDPANSLLVRSAHPGFGLEELLLLASEDEIRDVVSVIAAADRGLAALRAHAAPEQVVIAPTFEGSADVGGADGDWLVGGRLIDVKTTIHPGRLPLTDIYQLCGYALLDYHDAHRMTHLGWYSARPGAAIAWDAAEFFALLGARRPLPELRERTAHLLQQRRRAPTPTPQAGTTHSLPAAGTAKAATPPPATPARPTMVPWQEPDQHHPGQLLCGRALIHDTTARPADITRLYTRAEIIDRWGTDSIHINPPDEQLAAWVQRFDLTTKDAMLRTIASLHSMAGTVGDVHGWGDWSLPVFEAACAGLFRWWTWRLEQLAEADRAEIDAQVRALDRWCRAIYDDREMEGARD